MADSSSESRAAGVVYAGGTVRGQWQSAYGSRAASRATGSDFASASVIVA